MAVNQFTRIALLAALLAAAPAFGADDPAPAPAGPVVVLRGGLDQKVALHGVVSYDSAGSGAGMMMYPAPGLVGLLVAVAAHAAVSGGVRDAEKRKMRDQADLILAPHQELLNAFKHEDLFLDAVPRIAASSNLRIAGAQAATAAADIVVDTVPVFYMTQDRRALILDNAVSIRAPGQQKAFETIIRVVSPARDAGTEALFWFDASGARLRETSASLFSRSVDIALAEMRATPAALAPPAAPVAYRTVRYSEGGDERMERAQVVTTTCEDLVLRTLRGHLMAVPRRAGDEPADGLCPAPLKS